MCQAELWNYNELIESTEKMIGNQLVLIAKKTKNVTVIEVHGQNKTENTK